MNKSSTSKHRMTLLLFILLATLGLTGCDVNVNANAGALNNYFKVGNPDGKGIITTFSNVIDNNKAKITTFKTAYEVLAPKLSTSGDKIDFVSAINDMTARQNNLASSNLIENNEITPTGSDILGAISLKPIGARNGIDLKREMVKGIAFSVAAHIVGNPSIMKADDNMPSLISSYTSDTSGSSDPGSISKATVVYGYAVTSVHIELLDESGDNWYLKSYELLTNAGTSADALTKRASLTDSSNPTFTTSLGGSFTEKSRASKTSGFTTYKYFVGCTFDESPYSSAKTNASNDIKLTFKNGDGQAIDILSEFPKDKSKYRPCDAQTHYTAHAKPFTIYSLDEIKDGRAENMGSTEDDGATTEYRICIGTFDSLGLYSDGYFGGTGDPKINTYFPSRTYVYVYVKITNLNDYADYKSIYSTISSGTQTAYTATSGSTTCSKLIENIRDITNGLPIYTLRADAGNELNTYDASSIVDTMHSSSNSSTNNTKVNTKLFKNTGHTVDLLSETEKNKIDFNTTSDLYLGGIKVGTIMYESITTEASKGITGTILEADGTTSYTTAPMIRIMQTPESDPADPTYCIVNGVYRIGVIDAFQADISPSGNTYHYSAKPTTMFLDILDGKIYSLAQNGKAATFANTANMSIYSIKDIRMTHYTDNIKAHDEDDEDGVSTNYVIDEYYKIPQSSLVYNLCKNITGGNSSTFATSLNAATNSVYSPFILGTYMELIYCPGVYPNGVDAANSEQFICVGRKIVLDKEWFNTPNSITETTPAFTINNPDEDRAMATGGKATGYVKYLYSAKPERKNTTNSSGATADYQGLGRLQVSNASDVIVTSAYQTGLDIKHTNILYMPTIYTGEFKTTTDWLLKDSNRQFAKNETGTEKATSTITPGIYCIASTFGVQDNLAAYLGSETFAIWRSWLNANGYSTYLNGIEDKELADELISTLELTYNIALNGEEGQEDLTINSKDLEGVEEFMQNKNNKRLASILTIILRILGIIILTYGVALCIAYSIDVNVAGEGEGVLKRITFNRMKSCPGISKKEREAMTERSEKGTYTIHAIALADLIPIVVVLFIIATLLLIGAYPLVTQRIIYYADTLTQSIKQAITGK